MTSTTPLAPTREHKLIKFDLKLLDDSTHGGFSGYVSVFGNEDSHGDIIEPGAFKDGLADFIRDGFAPVGHDWSGLPVATIAEAFEDEHGLFMRCEFHSTAAAQDARTVVRERLARGKTVGLSVGYEVLEYAIIKSDDPSEWRYKRRLLKIKLYEGSIVTVPANALAGVTDAKSGLSLDDHCGAALAAVEQVVVRLGSLADLRRKDGRSLSAANQARLETLAARLGELRAATEPRPAVPDPAALDALWAKQLALESELLLAG